MKNIIDEKINIAIRNNVSKNRRRISATRTPWKFRERWEREEGIAFLRGSLLSTSDAYNNYDIPSQKGRRTGREERKGFRPFRWSAFPYRARIAPLFPSFTPWARRSAHIHPPSSSTTPRVLSDPQGVGARPCLLYRPPTIREVGRTRPSTFVEVHTAYLFVRVLPSLQKESGYPLLDLFPFSPTVFALSLCSDIGSRSRWRLVSL